MLTGASVRFSLPLDDTPTLPAYTGSVSEAGSVEHVEAAARSAMADWLGAAMYAGRKGRQQARALVRRELRQSGAVPAFECEAPDPGWKPLPEGGR